MKAVKKKKTTWQDCYLEQIEKSLKIVSNLTFNWMFIDESSLIDEKHWEMMEMNNKDDILYCKSMLIVNALKEAETRLRMLQLEFQKNEIHNNNQQ